MADPVRAGLWGLVRFDGCPVAAQDTSRLGLPRTERSRTAQGLDTQDPDFVDVFQDQGATTILTGWIADRREMAARMGLQIGANPARIAQAALAKFGKDAPAEMLGEWSLYHCEPNGTVWLMQAATTRDSLFFAASGARLAFAPDPMALRRLDWIDGGPDPEAIAMSVGTYALRLQMGTRSIWRGIEKLMSGESLRFAGDGTCQRRGIELLAPQPRFTGNANDALEALEETLRHLLRERLGMTGYPAMLLSGGLDSSVLAALAAQELEAPPIAICSVAPPGSGIPDEFAYARAVAERHGIAIEPVCPGPEDNPFRAPIHVMAGANFPIVSNRHCLVSCFHETARRLGATMLVDGGYGEMTITSRLPLSPTLRQRLGVIKRYILSNLQPDHRDFHVVLAPHRLPPLARARADSARPPRLIREVPDQIGYMAGCEKALSHSNAYFAGALRMNFPFRDLRLLRLYASLPHEVAYAMGPDRGPVRTIGKGLLPEAVRLRQRGMPADPGHYARLQAFASPARSRIAAFRAAGIDEWLDLGWLDQSLARVAEKGVRDVAEANHVQLTALAAEYLTWAQIGAS